MTTEELEALFEKHDDLYIEGLASDVGPTKRRDLEGFLLLDKLLPGEGDIVCGAGHDEIFLDALLEDLAKVASEEDVMNLIRCGVRIDEDRARLAMYV